MGAGSSTTASEVVTYIGVPLAVLGVLPILYNTVVTLAALSQIKRMLRHSRLTALTRSDVVNRVIEVDLPRYAVTPWDRFEHRDEYWSLCRNPSNIPGGTWTTFNWKANTIGIKTQRVEYADQLRQPQVEVSFDELISYLLDLGAVPDAQGWRLLRSTGLWTPVGCALMKSPDGHHRALTIAPLDDSDGNLSLAVSWSSQWTTRSHMALPPYWVRLPVPILPKSEIIEAEASSPTGKRAQSPARSTKSAAQGSVDTVQQEADSNSTRSLSCHVSVDGLVEAIPEDEDDESRKPDSLYIEHVRIRPGRADGVWFASAITAYGTTSQTILWNYNIPDDILAFAQKDTMPCGVLELLGVVDDSMTPEWATQHDDFNTSIQMHMRRNREQRMAMEAESRMTPAQREQAVRDRMRRESEQRLDEMRDRMRLENQRKETRVMEALQSPKWEATLVAEHNLRWLQANGHMNDSLSIKDAAGVVLHRMVLDGEFARSVCGIMDMWRVWADNAGMRKSDFNALREKQAVFAQASLLISVIKNTSSAAQGSLALDLQECLRMWRKVRLG